MQVGVYMIRLLFFLSIFIFENFKSTIIAIVSFFLIFGNNYSFSNLSFWIIIFSVLFSIIWNKYKIDITFNGNPKFWVFFLLNSATKSFLYAYMMLLPILIFEYMTNRFMYEPFELIFKLEIIAVNFSIFLNKYNIETILLFSTIIFTIISYFLLYKKIKKYEIFQKYYKLVSILIFFVFFLLSFSFLSYNNFHNIKEKWEIKHTNAIREMIAENENIYRNAILYEILENSIAKQNNNILESIIAFLLLLETSKQDFYIAKQGTKNFLYKNKHIIKNAENGLINRELDSQEFKELLQDLQINQKVSQNSDMNKVTSDIKNKPLAEELVYVFFEKIRNNINTYNPSVYILYNELEHNPVFSDYTNFQQIFSEGYNTDDVLREIEKIKLEQSKISELEAHKKNLLKETMVNILTNMLPSTDRAIIDLYIEKIIDNLSEIEIKTYSKNNGDSSALNIDIEKITKRKNYNIKIELQNFDKISYKFSKNEVIHTIYVNKLEEIRRHKIMADIYSPYSKIEFDKGSKINWGEIIRKAL